MKEFRQGIQGFALRALAAAGRRKKDDGMIFHWVERQLFFDRRDSLVTKKSALDAS